MKTLQTLKTELLADPEIRREYDQLALEYEIARQIIRARVGAGLTQAQLAQRMDTAQSFIAKLESGHTLPSAATIQKVAKATGTRARFEFVAA